MKTGEKYALGAAAVGVTGLIAYLLWKRSQGAGPPTIASSPFEWAQYTPTPLPPSHITPNTGDAYHDVSRDSDVNISVIPLFNSSGASLTPTGGACTSSKQCVPGDVCVNGQCVSEADWNA